MADVFRFFFGFPRRCLFDGIVNFFPMDGNIFGCFNAKPHPIATHLDYKDGHIIIDDNTFIYSTGENQHGYILSAPAARFTHA